MLVLLWPTRFCILSIKARELTRDDVWLPIWHLHAEGLCLFHCTRGPASCIIRIKAKKLTRNNVSLLIWHLHVEGLWLFHCTQPAIYIIRIKARKLTRDDVSTAIRYLHIKGVCLFCCGQRGLLFGILQYMLLSKTIKLEDLRVGSSHGPRWNRLARKRI